VSKRDLALAWLAFLGAVPWLTGCGDDGVDCTVVHDGGPFWVTLTAAPGGALPADLLLRLTASAGAQELTMADVAGNPWVCWFGGQKRPFANETAGADEPWRVSCTWGEGPSGIFEATAAAFQPATIALVSTTECDDCCDPWTRESAELELVAE
jgi:hypothetical protein